MRGGSGGWLLLMALASALFAGCGFEGADPGNPLRTRPPPTTETATDTDATEGEGNEDGDGDVQGNASSSSSSSSSSSGTSVAPPSGSGVFASAPAYVAQLGPSTRKAKHAFATNTPATNPAGRACQQCHGAAGPGPRFAFAGTIYKDDNATQPAAQVEVRVVDAKNQVFTAYTDADGNYFVRFTAAQAPAFPAKVGARDADTSRTMVAAASAGNCNNCHRTAGASAPIALP